MLIVGMFVVPAIMPLSDLLCDLAVCVLAVQGVQTASTRILWCVFPRLITTPSNTILGSREINCCTVKLNPGPPAQLLFESESLSSPPPGPCNAPWPGGGRDCATVCVTMRREILKSTRFANTKV
jgi:hypothetical protein